MKKLFLLTFALALLFMWAAAGADNAPSNLSVSKTGVPTIAKDRAGIEQEKDAAQQERPVDRLYKGLSPVLEAPLPEKQPWTGRESTPDPNVILQGGDTFETATLVPGIPYTDNGTTTDYTDDYDYTCRYDYPEGTSSADVVYSYTPEANICVDISLCATTWDTGLHVHDGAYPSEIYCDDDGCDGPGSALASVLTGVALTAGTTYYIVVDGYGSANGDYQIDITDCAEDLMVCPDGSIFDHPQDGSWCGVSDSEWPVKRFEDVHITGSICDIHFWGGRMTGSLVECFEDPMPFLIEFWSDDGSGLPDIVAGPTCTYSLSLTAVPTGEMFGTYFERMRYDAILDPCCDFGGGWVSIQAQSDGTGCYFWWLTTQPTDLGFSLEYTEAGGFEAWNQDLALCLTGELTGELGARCCPHKEQRQSKG